jgi:hypothetical protein
VPWFFFIIMQVRQRALGESRQGWEVEGKPGSVVFTSVIQRLPNWERERRGLTSFIVMQVRQRALGQSRQGWKIEGMPGRGREGSGALAAAGGGHGAGGYNRRRPRGLTAAPE